MNKYLLVLFCSLLFFSTTVNALKILDVHIEIGVGAPHHSTSDTNGSGVFTAKIIGNAYNNKNYYGFLEYNKFKGRDDRQQTDVFSAGSLYAIPLGPILVGAGLSVGYLTKKTSRLSSQASLKSNVFVLLPTTHFKIRASYDYYSNLDFWDSGTKNGGEDFLMLSIGFPL